MAFPTNSSLVFLALSASGTLALYAGCASSEPVSSTTVSSTSTSEASSTSATSSAASTAASTAVSTSAASSSSGAGGSGGAGGSAGWPTCDMPPMGVPAHSIHEVWQANYAQPTEAWIPGVFITGISGAGCAQGVACQIFVQSAETFADLTAGSQQAIKLFISAAAATHFIGLAVGDKVDVLGYPWRYNVSGQNELLVEVNNQFQGCAKKVGTGLPVPVSATLDDLTVDAYENTLGPLLVTIDAVSGKPQMPTETFGLWKTGTFNDAGVTTITSLSPYFLTGQAFVGLTQGKVHDFTTVTGVFGLFVQGGMTKYEELYPRQTSEYPVLKVH